MVAVDKQAAYGRSMEWPVRPVKGKQGTDFSNRAQRLLGYRLLASLLRPFRAPALVVKRL